VLDASLGAGACVLVNEGAAFSCGDHGAKSFTDGNVVYIANNAHLEPQTNNKATQNCKPTSLSPLSTNRRVKDKEACPRT
jgi:hypothetical protein